MSAQGDTDTDGDADTDTATVGCTLSAKGSTVGTVGADTEHCQLFSERYCIFRAV